MIELRFQHDLYDAAALDEALATYGAYGKLDLDRAGDASVVRVTSTVEGVDDRTLAAELGNYALGKAIECARARSEGPDAASQTLRESAEAAS